MQAAGRNEERERIEIELLLEGIYRYYGYDFRNYAGSSIRRRIWHRINIWGLGSISALQERVLHDQASMTELMASLSVSVTEMFRDPELFAAFRKLCVPRLRRLPSIRIWHAGCATGEEVLSMAILLEEEGLLERARLYATDMNEEALEQAKAGVFHLRKMREYTRNYLLSGGSEEFSEYYTVKDEHAVFHPRLLDNVVFAQHNLATDQSFNEFHVIFCRNVLIYFNKTLQDRAHELFYDSLAVDGLLGLGNRESINFTPRMSCYEEILPHEKLYRKVK